MLLKHRLRFNQIGTTSALTAAVHVVEAAMSFKSDFITWQSWSRKWGDWRTWFPKMNGLREPMQRDPRFRVVALEKPLEKIQKVNATEH